jgi:mRNA interferase RelE/StbE
LYRLKFGKRALKEWRALDTGIQRQFQKKLDKILVNPHVPSMHLSGFPGCYRIKLRKAGMRLGYKVIEAEIVVLVIAVGPRDKDEIYEDFAERYNAGS